MSSSALKQNNTNNEKMLHIIFKDIFQIQLKKKHGYWAKQRPENASYLITRMEGGVSVCVEHNRCQTILFFAADRCVFWVDTPAARTAASKMDYSFSNEWKNLRLDPVWMQLRVSITHRLFQALGVVHFLELRIARVVPSVQWYAAVAVTWPLSCISIWENEITSQ